MKSSEAKHKLIAIKNRGLITNSSDIKALNIAIKLLEDKEKQELEELTSRDKMLDDYYNQSVFNCDPW